MAVKHTPGPWTPMIAPNMTATCCDYAVVGPSGLEVTRCWHEEDVRLIAAAPEMLEELKYILGELEHTDREQPPYIVLEDLRRIIRKAEGW